MADDIRECSECGARYRLTRQKPGRIDQCDRCGQRAGEVERVGGNMIWHHKTGPEIEIKSGTAARDFAAKTRRLGAGVTASLCESKAGAEKELFKHGQWMSTEPLKGD
jgi:hypothetical protein